MFDKSLCLNTNHPDVKKWIDSIGKENMYKVFVQNGYFLPDYESYSKSEQRFDYSIEEIKSFLNKLVPTNQYEFDTLNALKSKGFDIQGTAAFYKKTFYFKDKVNKNELAEEAFHSIVQTLMDSDEQTLIYNAGRELLTQRLKTEKKSFNNYIQELQSKFNVSREVLEQYAYEEEIAKDFVNYYNSEGKSNRYSQNRINSLTKKLTFLGKNAQKIAELLHTMYERIKALFNITTNETEVLALFDKISKGQFRDKKIVNNNDNIIPSFRIYYNSDERIIPSDEISQMKKSIAVLAKNLNESEGIEIDKDSVINLAIEKYSEFLINKLDNEENELKQNLYSDLIELLDSNDEDLIEEITEQYEANKTIFDEAIEFDVESKEDEQGRTQNFDDSANQQSLETRSKELKILMSTTGKIVGGMYLDATGKTIAYESNGTITDLQGNILDTVEGTKIDVLEIPDQTMIYSAIVRKLSNTKSERERFIKLLELSMDGDGAKLLKKGHNSNTKTFINALLKDVIGDTSDENKKRIKEQLVGTNSLSDIIKADTKPLHVQRFLLALRGFNLFARNVYRTEIDIELGWGKVSNVESSSQRNNQKKFWSSNYRELQYQTTLEDYKENFNKLFEEFIEQVNFPNRNQDVINNLTIIYDQMLTQLGIDVNEEYLLNFMQDLVNNNNIKLLSKSPLNLAALTSKLEAINDFIKKEDKFLELYEEDDLSTDVGKSLGTTKDFNAFFNFIADGNIEYDERVAETSYKDGNDNSIYKHQNPTFTLKFANSFQSEEEFNELLEGGIIGIDVNGNPIKSTILDSFKKNNPLLDMISIDGQVKDTLRKGIEVLTLDTTQIKSYSYKTDDGFLIEKDSEYTEKNVLALDDMGSAEYALTNLILLTENARKITYNGKDYLYTPVSLGHNEASKQIDYLMIPFDGNALVNNVLSEQSKQHVYKLIKAEFDKIKENSNELRIQVDLLKKLKNTDVITKVTRNDLYELVAKTDYEIKNVYESYNTGEILEKDGYILPAGKRDKSFKGLRFSPEVEPFVNEELLIKALKGEELNIEDLNFGLVTDFLNEEVKWIKEQGLMDKLPHALRYSYFLKGKEVVTLGKNTNGVQIFSEKSKTEDRLKIALFNYWLGSTMSNRMRYGSHNFNFKVTSTEAFKRYRMFNGATLSTKTSIKNDSLGIYKDVSLITYATIQEPKAKSDINAFADIDENKKWIDQADAAMKSTPKGLRKILHGIGRLTKRVSDILDKVEQGVELTEKEWDNMINSDSLLAALKPLAANGEQTIKTGLTPTLTLSSTSYSTIIEPDSIDGNLFTFGNNTIKVDEYGRTTQTVGNKREIIWDNTNKVFKEWKPRLLDKNLTNYSQRMFLNGYRKVNGEWVYKGEAYEIDTLVPPTALKTSQRNILPFTKVGDKNVTNFDFDDKLNDNYTFANAIDADYFGEQVQNPQGKVKITTPTQNIEILSNELTGDIIIKTFDKKGNLKEEKITSDELIILYEKLKSKRNINGKELAVSELFKKIKDENGNVKEVPNYKYFFDGLIQGLKLTGGSGQDYEFLAVNPDGTPVYNVNIPLNKDKMIQSIMKHFSSGVLSHKVAGNAYVLASDHGVRVLKKLIVIRDNQGNITDYTWEVINKKTEGYDQLIIDNKPEDLSDLIYDHRAWQLGNKQASKFHQYFESPEIQTRIANGEEIYFSDSLRYMKKSYIKQGDEYVFNTWVSEAMIPKLNAKQKSIQNSIRFMLGVRIPSQDKQSSVNIEWVDFLDDTIGNTIVIPKEIVQIAGSDFDIDKLYVSQYEGYWEDGEYKNYEDTFTDYKKWIFKTSKAAKLALKDKLKFNENYQSLLNNKKSLFENSKLLYKQVEFIIDNISQESGLTYEDFKLQLKEFYDELKSLDAEENEFVKKSLKEGLFYQYKDFIELNKPLKEVFKEIELNKNYILETTDKLNIEKNKEQEIILTQFGLFSSEKEFKTGFNNAVKNNEILNLQRAMLTSDSVLFGDSKNPARGTGDTPMDLSLLEDLQKNSKVSYSKNTESPYYKSLEEIKSIYGEGVKIEQDENSFIVYPFIQNDKEILTVEKNKKVPHNALSTHANYQQGTIIARRGIGVTVNGLLQAIVANRINLQLTNKFNFTYNGETVKFGYNIDKEKVGYTDHNGNRTFAIKNTIVSAATDEAKEEQLKRHGIKGDDLNVVDLLTNFGFSIDESIAIINSKLVKKYKNFTEKGKLESKADKRKELSKEEKDFNDLIFNLKNQESVDLTPQKIFEGLYKEDNELLTVYLKVADMSKELSKVAKLIKGKKGYTNGQLSELVEIENIATELGLIETLQGYKPTGYFDWTNLKSEKASDIQSFVDITQDLKSTKLNQMFIEYQEISQDLKNIVLKETNKPDDVNLASKIQKDVNTFLIIQLLKRNVNSNNQFIVDFLNIDKLNPLSSDNFLDKFFENKALINENSNKYKLLKNLIGVKGKVNTIRNSESVDSLRLAAISKLNPAQQDNIRNLFLEMYTSENKEEKQFAENLFAYFILKDGLQFRQYNISKIFPTIMFREVSKVLDTFEDTIAKISPKEKEDLLSKFKSLWFADIRNKKHRIKLKGSDESKVFSAYRIKDKQKTKIFSKDFVINQPPLYLQIEKNGEKNEYTKVGIDSINIQGGVKPKLPQYVDYLGASYRKFYTTSKIKLQFQTKKGLKEYSYRIEEEVNQQDENLRVFNLTGKNKEFKLVVQITNVIGNVNSYNAQLFENEQFVENVKIDYKELQNIERFSYKNQPVVYIREPYYGSTITDLTVDAGLIPAVSEVNAKQGVSKLQDLVNQLKEENQKLGYIQFYENLLSKRYSPNFDKSFKEETISKMESKGEEISSYSDNLAFALTNPTHTSPQGS